MKKIFSTLLLCVAVVVSMSCKKNDPDPQPFDDYLMLTLNSTATESKLTEEMLGSASKIKISGTINAADFRVLRTHEQLEYLHLGDAGVVGKIIVGYGFNEETEKYEALTVNGNAIPYGAFGEYTEYSEGMKAPGDKIEKLYNDFTGVGMMSSPNNDGHNVIAAHKRIKSIVFPSKITHIGRNAFTKCTTLTEPIQFPSTIYTIMDSAFQGCKNLTGELNFPAEIAIIGNFAFWHCSALTGTLTIPKNITTIYVFAFLGCKGFTDLKMHDEIEVIGDSAFGGMEKVTTLTLPKNLEGIGVSAFSGWTSLKGDLTLPEGFKEIYDRAFYDCRNLDGTLTLNEGIEKIKDYAFHGANFKKIIAKWSKEGNLIPEGFFNSESFWFPENFQTSAKKPEYVIYVPKGELDYYKDNFVAADGTSFYNFKETEQK